MLPSSALFMVDSLPLASKRNLMSQRLYYIQSLMNYDIFTRLKYNRPAIWGQCYKTFYRSNLLPFHGNTIILCYKAILPW